MDNLDFTNGNSWGNALHASTMFPVNDYGSWLSRYFDKKKNRRRYQVMVHTPKNPVAGSTITYRAERGIVTGKIYDIEWCVNPTDMATIYFVVED